MFKVSDPTSTLSQGISALFSSRGSRASEDRAVSLSPKTLRTGRVPHSPVEESLRAEPTCPLGSLLNGVPEASSISAADRPLCPYTLLLQLYHCPSLPDKSDWLSSPGVRKGRTRLRVRHLFPTIREEVRLPFPARPLLEGSQGKIMANPGRDIFGCFSVLGQVGTQGLASLWALYLLFAELGWESGGTGLQSCAVVRCGRIFCHLVQSPLGR